MKKLLCTILIFGLLIGSTCSAFAYSQVKNGSSGEDVKTLQTMLNAVQNAGLDVDGKFGKKTEQAVRAFQSANGLDVDGICGPKTWAALEAQYQSITSQSMTIVISPEPTPTPSTPSTQVSHSTVRNGSKGAEVTTLQTMLNAIQNAGLDVDGIFGKKTEQAVRNFQNANGLVVDGICGPKTWAALESKYNPPTTVRTDLSTFNDTINYLNNESFTVVEEGAPVRSLPAKSGSVVRTTHTGDALTAVASGINLQGNLWYRLSDGNYIYSGNVEKTSVPSGWVPCSKTMFTVGDVTYIRKDCYSTGEKCYELPKGSEVKVTHYLINSKGNKWYVTSDGYFVYSERLTMKDPFVCTLYYYDGVSANPHEETCGSNVSISNTYIPKRDGYTFAGWAESSDTQQVKYQPGDSFSMISTSGTASIKLYAVWRAKNTYLETIERITTEIVSGTSTISKVDDSGAPYWSWYYGKTSTRDDGWCAVYTSWLVSQAGIPGLKTADPNTQEKRMKDAGAFKQADYNPRTGDLVFFTKNGSNVDHVGMIVLYNGEVLILQGNFSRSVKVKKMGDICFKAEKLTFKDAIDGFGDMQTYINNKGY